MLNLLTNKRTSIIVHDTRSEMLLLRLVSFAAAAGRLKHILLTIWHAELYPYSLATALLYEGFTKNTCSLLAFGLVSMAKHLPQGLADWHMCYIYGTNKLTLLWSRTLTVKENSSPKAPQKLYWLLLPYK